MMLHTYTRIAGYLIIALLIAAVVILAWWRG